MSRYLVPSLRKALFERDGYRCKKCRHHAPDGESLHANHIKPVSQGGLDLLENLDTLCAMCHAELSWVWNDQPPVPYDEWLRLTPAAILMRMLLAMRGGSLPDEIDPAVGRAAIESATGLTADIARRLLERRPP